MPFYVPYLAVFGWLMAGGLWRDMGRLEMSSKVVFPAARPDGSIALIDFGQTKQMLGIRDDSGELKHPPGNRRPGDFGTVWYEPRPAV